MRKVTARGTIVDLRPAFLKIRDQGQRGTCVAFAVTSAHEYERSGGGIAAEQLSEEALYWGCKVVDGNWRKGTQFASASAALSTTGQPLEAVWPYDERRAHGVAYSPPTPPDASWHTSSLIAMAADTGTVRAVLDLGRPVVIGAVVFDSMYRPTTRGRVNPPPAGAVSRGRHALLAVGYNADALLVRNSWGTTWGLGGYGWLTDAYLARYLTAAWAIDAAAATSPADPTSTVGDVYGAE